MWYDYISWTWAIFVIHSKKQRNIISCVSPPGPRFCLLRDKFTNESFLPRSLGMDLKTIKKVQNIFTQRSNWLYIYIYNSFVNQLRLIINKNLATISQLCTPKRIVISFAYWTKILLPKIKTSFSFVWILFICVQFVECTFKNTK